MLASRSVACLLRCSGPKTNTNQSVYKPLKSFNYFNSHQSFSTKNSRRPFWKTQNVGTKTIEPWRLLVGGAAVAGLAGTCLYGAISPTKPGTMSSTLEQSIVWPSYVGQRVHSTYAYMLGTVGMAAGSAVALLRTPAFIRMVTRGGWAVPIGMFLATAGSQIACSSINYPHDGSKINIKHAAWVLFSGCMGAMLSPVILLAGEQALLSRACIYTGGIVTSLSAVATVAPSERFLSWAGPLSIGFGVVFIASLGSVFMSPMSRVGMGLYNLSVYGGLALFSGFLLYDTQNLVRRAKMHPIPEYSVVPFDPINNSISISVDIFNIFVRIVSILAGNNRKK